MDMSAQTPMSASSRQNTHESIQLCRKPNNSAEVSLKNAGDSLRTFFGEGQAWWHANHTQWLKEEEKRNEVTGVIFTHLNLNFE